MLGSNRGSLGQDIPLSIDIYLRVRTYYISYARKSGTATQRKEPRSATKGTGQPIPSISSVTYAKIKFSAGPAYAWAVTHSHLMNRTSPSHLGLGLQAGSYLPTITARSNPLLRRGPRGSERACLASTNSRSSVGSVYKITLCALAAGPICTTNESSMAIRESLLLCVSR
ncbi:uncharacterized protein BDZ83DRAFT_121833 [Colletotrichum acutatum]|uniref:Uncharacterized protein n=1 Tax=Glomerella acutata TaxID=27357 RepID=A0AAD8XCP8_GLOAC|nr:uncharacterized protein BDZ83DRAFT_121833 [Colletotrichum acutatum]KAK1711187.1 hypothetical protein BDZ83DRAFT_121833 [Colletotrichum acutatum]